MEAAPHGTRRTPIIVDSRMNTAFMIKYIIYALFGFMGMLSGTPTVEAVAGLTVARTVAGFIFVASVIAAVSVKRDVVDRRWKKLELYSTWVLVSFISVYFFAAAWLAIDGDRGRVSAGMLALGLIVMPIWRIGWLIRELRHP